MKGRVAQRDDAPAQVGVSASFTQPVLSVPMRMSPATWSLTCREVMLIPTLPGPLKAAMVLPLDTAYRAARRTVGPSAVFTKTAVLAEPGLPRPEPYLPASCSNRRSRASWASSCCFKRSVSDLRKSFSVFRSLMACSM